MHRSLFWLLDHYPDTGESLAAVHATALAHARLADRLGYTGLWLAEHHFQNLGTAANPAVVLAAIAQCTRRLRLGPAVCVLPLRNPLLVAEEYALIDVLSGGRLDMGVGTGSQPLEFEALGCDFEHRRKTFDDRLAVLRHAWRSVGTGERVAPALNVAPLQLPTPPMFVAVMHEESAHAVGLAGNSMLTLVSPMTQDLDEIRARIAAHAQGLEEGGHAKASARAVVVVFACVAESDGAARRVAAPALGRLIQALVGVAPEDPADLFDRMRERDTGLFGSAAGVASQLERYARIGVEHVAFVSRFGGMHPSAAESSLRALAP